MPADKEKTLTFRISEAERIRIIEKANHYGLSVSDYIRAAVFGDALMNGILEKNFGVLADGQKAIFDAIIASPAYSYRKAMIEQMKAEGKNRNPDELTQKSDQHIAEILTFLASFIDKKHGNLKMDLVDAILAIRKKETSETKPLIM